jgi:hypothetical protein
VKQEQAEMTMRKVMVLSSVRVHFHFTQQPWDNDTFQVDWRKAGIRLCTVSSRLMSRLVMKANTSTTILHVLQTNAKKRVVSDASKTQRIMQPHQIFVVMRSSASVKMPSTLPSMTHNQRPGIHSSLQLLLNRANSLSKSHIASTQKLNHGESQANLGI